jgi:acyl-CoA thioester hydrolase
MGLVAEASYLRWFEMGRAALLKENGLDYRQFEALGYLLPVLEIGLIFQRRAYHDDVLQIITTLRARPKFRIRLEYEVRREGLLLAVGHSIQGFVNRGQRPVKPPPDFLAKLDTVFPRMLSADGASIQNSTAGP